MTSTTLDRVERIFWICNTSKTPVRRLSSACSKVGWLARHDEDPTKPRRGILHYLESALNEQKHGTLLSELAKNHDGGKAPERASELRNAASRHFNDRDRDLASFERAVKRAVRNAELEADEPTDADRDAANTFARLTVGLDEAEDLTEA